MMLLKCCLQSGHTAFTLDHSNRHVKQKVWKQLSVKDLFCSFPRQMEQLGSGDCGRSGDFPVASSSAGLVELDAVGTAGSGSLGFWLIAAVSSSEMLTICADFSLMSAVFLNLEKM